MKQAASLLAALTVSWALCVPLAASEEVLPLVIEFPAASNELNRAARANLKPVAELLAQNPELRLLLAAFAIKDEVKDGLQARTLALERALKVRGWLVRQSGAEANRMILKPSIPQSASAGRVEIRRLDGEARLP